MSIGICKKILPIREFSLIGFFVVRVIGVTRRFFELKTYSAEKVLANPISNGTRDYKIAKP